MSNITVRPVETRRERKAFLSFPWELYRNDPLWIPPLRQNQKELVGYAKHPFYERNRCQTFVAYRNGRPCGRIAGILNLGHIDRYEERRGFLGFFDAENDPEIAYRLFDAVRGWFAAQHIYNLRGPTNPSLNYELGLLIEGFDTSPFFMMTYNPPYYQEMFESYGFKKSQDLVSFWGHVDLLPKIRERLGPLAEQVIERYNVKLRTLDRSRFMEDVCTFLSVYNRSLENTWGFVPMSDAELHHMAQGLKHLIVPELTSVAEVDGQVVGAAFGLPDYNPRIKKINGRLLPFGFLHLLRNRRQIKKIRMISTNVIPEYQRMGLGLALMAGVEPMAERWGLTECEFSWVLESNRLSYGALKKGGAEITKTYRIYDFDCETPALTSEPPVRLPPYDPNANHSSDDEDDFPRPIMPKKKPAEKTEPIEGESREIAARPITPLMVPTPKGKLEVRQVVDRKTTNDFVRVPYDIYRYDPHWVAQLEVEVKESINPKKHPFYLHGKATQFVAYRDDTPIGRILVSDDPNYNKLYDTNVGCFGMFECHDDEEAAHALLDQGAKWLRELGRDSVMGPIDYSINYPCGLLIDGFHTPPRIMMNHNPPYYARLIESWGMTKIKDIYAWWFTDKKHLQSGWKRLAERMMKRGKVTIRPFRMRDMQNEVKRCNEIYSQAMDNHWGFVKMTDEELAYMAKRLSMIAQSEMFLMAEMDGQPVGISFTLPDFNEAIAPLRGRIFRFGSPLGILRILRRNRHIRTCRLVALDVLEKYRRRGIAEMMLLRTLDYGRNKLHYTGAELGWTLEDNESSTRMIQAAGGELYKSYRIYQKALD